MKSMIKMIVALYSATATTTTFTICNFLYANYLNDI